MPREFVSITTDDLNARVTRMESDVAALQRQYDQLRQDVLELRGDMTP